jgi:predicted nucleic acid-binding protein
VILVDTNLIYSYIQDMPQHEAALRWLDEQFRGGVRVGLPWASLLAFVRLVSNPKVFKAPVPVVEA